MIRRGVVDKQDFAPSWSILAPRTHAATPCLAKLPYLVLMHDVAYKDLQNCPVHTVYSSSSHLIGSIRPLWESRQPFSEEKPVLYSLVTVINHTV
jgi:hypothetical protein